MTAFLILTAAQAADVAGETAPGHFIEPVMLADGATFVLPLAVLDDPAHAERHPELATMPQRAVAADEWQPPED